MINGYMKDYIIALLYCIVFPKYIYTTYNVDFLVCYLR